MNIWLAALCSLGILGAGAIFFALAARLIVWISEGNHEIVLWVAAIIGVFVVLAAYICIEGGAA